MGKQPQSAGPPDRTVRVLTKKRSPPRGICILVENGIPCSNRSQSRGLCNKHLHYLRAHDRLAEFALPKRTSRDRRHTFRLKPSPAMGVCRVIVNGESCSARAQRRGLCSRHYSAIWQRSDLDLDDFALPAHVERRIRRRRYLQEGLCRVRENGVDCTEPAYVRGLCRKHYRWLTTREPALFEQLATPDPKAKRYRLRSRPKEGRCRLAVNGRGCPRPAEVRGLCAHHYDVLRRKPDLMAEIALPTKEPKARQFERRGAASAQTALCVVIENGVPCSRPPEHRGVCRYHRRAIGDHPDYSLDDFYLPEPVPVLTRKEPEEMADGLCCAVENGEACATAPHTRGLCRKHYKMATKLGVLEKVALPSRRNRARFGRGNDRPHFYLDKNVLFDYADARIFDSGGQSGSVAIVERVIKGQVRASVSADAIKSTYNHLRHRLTRPAVEGGRDASEEEAELAARQFVQEVFCGGGAWRMICPDAGAFRQTLSEPCEGLSLEDALEYRAYQAARVGKAGPTMFVTRDAHFPEGVHPVFVARDFGWR